MKKVILEWTKTILITLVIFFSFRAYVAEAYYIPSGSMMPTLNISDRIITNKFIYNFTDIKRGDVVVFNPPIESKSPFVKRVIGLPNETISVNNGVVYIDNEPLEESYISAPPINNFSPYKIPDNNYFLMGDNRNSSNDSRFWGTVSIDDIIGKAEFIYYPISDMKMLSFKE